MTNTDRQGLRTRTSVKAVGVVSNHSESQRSVRSRSRSRTVAANHYTVMLFVAQLLGSRGSRSYR